MSTKIRLPQLRGDSLKAGDANSLVFKEQGGSDNYLQFDTNANEIKLGSANIPVVLNGNLGGSALQDDSNFASAAANKVASSASIKSYADALDIGIAGDSGTGSVSMTQSLTVDTSNGLSSAASGQTITVSGVDASTSAKGVASFASADFAVSSGAVSVKAQGVSLSQIVNATASAKVLGRVSNGSGSFEEIVIDADIAGGVSADDDTLASAKAIKTYVDAQITAQDLDFQADTGGALAIDLDSETLSIVGTSNEIETAGSGNQVQIGLPDDVTVGQDLTVTRDLKVNGDLIVEGSKVIVNTKELLLQDHRISMGAPGDFKEGTYTFAQTGSSPNYTHTFTITVANSLSSGDHALVVDPEGNLPSDATYSVTSLSGTGYTITRTNQPNSLTVTGTKAIFACEVGITSNKPENGSGLFFPAKDAPVSFLYDDALSRMELVAPGNGCGLRVTGESRLERKVEALDVVEAHDALEFHAGGDKQVFTQPANYGGGNKAINIPAANGTLAVSADAVGGLALSAAGDISINPDNATDRTGTALAGSDTIIANVNGDVGHTTIQKVADFIQGAAQIKLVGSLDVSGGVMAIAGAGALNAGDSYPAAPAAGTGLPTLPSAFRSAGANDSKHEFYLNGMLLVRGPDADLGSVSPSGDYQFDTDAANGGGGAALGFSIDLEVGDILQFIHRP